MIKPGELTNDAGFMCLGAAVYSGHFGAFLAVGAALVGLGAVIKTAAESKKESR